MRFVALCRPFHLEAAALVSPSHGDLYHCEDPSAAVFWPPEEMQHPLENSIRMVGWVTGEEIVILHAGPAPVPHHPVLV